MISAFSSMCFLIKALHVLLFFFYSSSLLACYYTIFFFYSVSFFFIFLANFLNSSLNFFLIYFFESSQILTYSFEKSASPKPILLIKDHLLAYTIFLFFHSYVTLLPYGTPGFLPALPSYRGYLHHFLCLSRLPYANSREQLSQKHLPDIGSISLLTMGRRATAE